MLLERHHIGIETSEQEPTIVLETRNLRQVMRAVLVEVLRISRALWILRLEQLAGVVEGPAVERTGIARLVAALVAANHGAAVRACVEESVELAFAIPRDDDRLAADVAGDVVVVVGDLTLVSKIDPVPLPDVLHLQLEQLEVREDAATAAEDASLGVILDGGFQAFDNLV
jgi:AcrR family transcriptional regulator